MGDKITNNMIQAGITGALTGGSMGQTPQTGFDGPPPNGFGTMIGGRNPSTVGSSDSGSAFSMSVTSEIGAQASNGLNKVKNFFIHTASWMWDIVTR